MFKIGTLLILAMLAACRTPAVQSETPALLSNPGPETRRELEQTVSAALDGAAIMLAEDVLTRSSVLVIERGMQRGINRPPELGRDLGRPHRFQLVMDGSGCVLVDQESDRHWRLRSVECIAE